MQVKSIVEAIKRKSKGGLGLLVAIPLLLILAPLVMLLIATAAVAAIGIAVGLQKFGKQRRIVINDKPAQDNPADGRGRGRVIEGSYEVL